MRLVIMACIFLLLAGCTGKGVEVRAGDPREGVRKTPKVEPKGSPQGGRPTMPPDGRMGVWLDDRDWQFRPWVEGFQHALHLHWTAPYAYRLGITSGATRLRLVINRDGTLASLEIIEEEGHPSFTESSRAAVEKTFPLAPLPPDFKGERLTMTLQLNYPPSSRK